MSRNRTNRFRRGSDPRIARRGRALVAVTMAALLASSVPAGAHPHSWIDLLVAVPFNSAGAATGLRETWLFDEFYTAFVLEGVETDRNGRPQQAFLDDMLRQNMANLAEYGYFTSVRHGERPVPLGTVTEMSTRMNGDRLEITFLVPFRTPVNAATAPLVYSIYDPTYYIEMVHLDDSGAITLAGAPSGCRHQLFAPNPDVEAVSLAAALDQTESAGDGLGIHFAERVEIRCG